MAFKEKIDEIKIFETLLLFLTKIWWIQNSSSLSIMGHNSWLFDSHFTRPKGSNRLRVGSILKDIFEIFSTHQHHVFNTLAPCD